MADFTRAEKIAIMAALEAYEANPKLLKPKGVDLRRLTLKVMDNL